MADFHFFLGGNDLEMEAIRRLLHFRGIPDDHIHDKRLGWGAKTSDYTDEIEELPKSALPVLLELEDDLGILRRGGIALDHHGERAGIEKPTVLEQLWRFLDMPREKWGKDEFADFPLIVANDRGHIAAMRRLGATNEQIADIRARDRAAQGVTPAQEAQAEAALRACRSEAGGRLILAALPHDKTSALVDRLALEGEAENLLVISPGEINFYGGGELVLGLNRTFPGGWFGGELPERGYWGLADPTKGEQVRKWLINRIESPDRP